MRGLIERQIYRPAVVLPMVALVELMVSVDFNLGQAGAVVATRGARAALHRSRGLFSMHRSAKRLRRSEPAAVRVDSSASVSIPQFCG